MLNSLDPEITDNYWKTRGGEEERILQSAIGTKQPHMVLDHEKKRDETVSGILQGVGAIAHVLYVGIQILYAMEGTSSQGG